MLRTTFIFRLLGGLAVTVLPFASSALANDASCENYPEVPWWNNLSHEKVIAYVDQNNGGDWDTYLEKWERQLARVVGIQGEGKSINIPSTGTQLEGNALADYIKKLKARVKINSCLAQQVSEAAIIEKADAIAQDEAAAVTNLQEEITTPEPEMPAAEPEMIPEPETEPEAAAVMSFEDAVAAFQADEHETALTAFKSLADAGNVEAQNALGYMYRRGLGTDKDILQSKFWYMKSARQDNAVAQYSLGEITRKEGQTKVQQAAALEWITKAANNNYPDAQYTLGLVLFQGDGIAQDLPEAYFWLSLGSRNEHEKSAKLLAHVGTLIDEDSKLEQDQRIEDWLSKRP